MTKIERDLKIIDLYTKGIPVKEIVSIVNLNQSSVYEKLKKAGVKTKTPAQAATKYSCNELFFSKIDNELNAYWLGFIYADGCISKPKNKSPFLQIAISRKDEDLLYKFKEHINFTGPVLYIQPNNSKQSRIRITSSKLVNDLIKHGIIYKKSLKLKYPTIPNKLQKHFIRGYFDGDGGIAKNNTEITIAGTESFLNSTQNIFNKVLGTTITKLYKKENIFQYTKHGRLQVAQILKWLYKDSFIYLDRKYNCIRSLVE